MKKKVITVPVPIVELALGRLEYDDAYPNVGMGMFPHAALNEILERHNLTKHDVDYDGLLKQILEARYKKR